MAIEESTARAGDWAASGAVLGWPAPKISRLENGKRALSETDVAIFLAGVVRSPTDKDYREVLPIAAVGGAARQRRAGEASGDQGDACRPDGLYDQHTGGLQDPVD
jgi:hypothetical protein